MAKDEAGTIGGVTACVALQSTPRSLTLSRAWGGAGDGSVSSKLVLWKPDRACIVKSWLEADRSQGASEQVSVVI